MASILKVDTIQDQSGNNIINESANTITIGASGDTITIPSGATLANSGIITGFESTGIDDNATGTSLTIASDGRTTLDATNEKPLVVHHSDGSTVRIGMNNNSTNANEIAFESTDFTVKPGGFEKFRIDSVGNTLINTTSTKGDDAATFAPVLTVNGGSYDGLIEVAGNRSDAADAGVARLQFIQNSNSATYKEVAEIRVETEGATANQRGGRISFRTRANASTNTTERMRINSSGNVGIGTSSPETKLHVFSASSGASAHSNGDDLFIENSGACGITIGSGATSVGTINFADSSAQYDGFIEYNHSNRSMRFATAISEAMRIDSSGRVIIGGTTPDTSAKLTLEGGDLRFNTDDKGILWGNNEINGNNASDFINIVTAGTERMRIDSSGNVGIGNSAPVVKLHVGDTSTGSAGSTGKTIVSSQDFSTTYSGGAASTWSGLQLVNHDDTSNRTATGVTFVHRSSGSGIAGIVSTSASADRGDIRFITRGSGNTIAERAIINDDGKVGINTTSPYGKFEVHSGGGQSNYSGSSAIKSGVTWGSESSSHTIDLFNYNENDNSSGMLLVHAKGDNNKCGTLMLLFTKKGGSGVGITTVSSRTDGMSTFSASTSGNTLTISTDSDCAICWQSYYGV